MTTVQDRLRERFDRLKKLYMKKAEEIFEEYWEDELIHNEIVVKDDPYDIYRLDGWGQRGSEWTDCASKIQEQLLIMCKGVYMSRVLDKNDANLIDFAHSEWMTHDPNELKATVEKYIIPDLAKIILEYTTSFFTVEDDDE